MVGASVFVFVIDGSPFRAEVWIAYKESSWMNALVWILLVICFQSIALCAYVVRESFYLSPEQPSFLILFNKNGRNLMLSDPLLIEDDDV
ncbi:hypothetical protein M8C21_005886 [Ambrosia artemisiifolia]|uniref:Uncharacterized protein n=1 Tax=Ambrosia artemisiifolia TaxID=4212 RepID=A0AAD5C8T0_AMBAR|nr:hypothetical protein M8C21_005886 [Ambrosia artemisiifolia]